MNKEAIVAIIIGVALGLFGAIYFSNFRTIPKGPSNKPQTFNTANLTPRTTDKSTKLAQFDKLPVNGALLTNKILVIQGQADKNSNLLIADQLEIRPITIRGNQFKQELQLKPGLNEIALFELNGEKEQLKVLKLYYLQTQNIDVSSDQSEATDEADVLKQKLEEKVLQLRNNPKRVISGPIKAIGEKSLTLGIGTDSIKVTVEPEITNFFNVSGYDLETISFADLQKGERVTAFVSDIGGDQISYTVYQEPALTVAAGKVSNIDEDNYEVTIIDFDKSSFGADIQVSTIQNLYNLKSQKIEKAGFSKLAIGQRIFAILSGTKGDYSIDEYLILQ